jgi:hypothetical protein
MRGQPQDDFFQKLIAQRTARQQAGNVNAIQAAHQPPQQPVQLPQNRVMQDLLMKHPKIRSKL